MTPKNKIDLTDEVVDVELLRDQRNALLYIVTELDGDRQEKVDGIINFLDYLLDRFEGYPTDYYVNRKK